MKNNIKKIIENLIDTFLYAGKISLELKQAQEAIRFLEKCLEIKRDYSVCCTLLSRAYILENRQEEAKDLLIKGIAIAHEKGELMPKQEMEMLLQQLNEG